MIDKVSNAFPAVNPEAGAVKASASGPSFSDVLGNAINKAADLEIESSRIAQKAAAGSGADLQTVTIASEKALLAVQLTVQVRNRVVEAYQEIMRTQV